MLAHYQQIGRDLASELSLRIPGLHRHNSVKWHTGDPGGTYGYSGRVEWWGIQGTGKRVREAADTQEAG